MTCIIAYKRNNEMYIGGDSAVATTYTIFTSKVPKVFVKNEMLLGYTTSFRMGYLLQYKLEIPKKPSRVAVSKYMNTLFIDSVIQCFESNGFCKIDANEKTGGQFIACYKNRIFFIDGDFQVNEPTRSFHACGSGMDVALGSMSALLKYDRNIDPVKLIRTSLEAAFECVPSVRPPFKVLKL